MAPAKTSKGGNDESKSETPNNTKEKSNHAAGNQSNGKSRRVASAAASNLRDVTSAASPGSVAPPSGTVTREQDPPRLQWSEFDREFLHAYRRTYRLDTPTAFSNEYHKLVLSRPGGIGLHSPTMARRKDFRRQSKEELSNAVRTHFAGMGVIESNALTDLFHKVKNRGVSKTRRPERVPRDMDR